MPELSQEQDPQSPQSTDPNSQISSDRRQPLWDGDVGGFERNLETTGEIQSALAAGQYSKVAEPLIGAQLQELLISDVASAITGGDPLYEAPVGRAMGAHTEASLAHYLIQKGEKWQRRQEVLDAEGWGEIRDFRDEVVTQFRQHNETVASLDPEERMQQSRPVEMDPSRLADMRGRTAQIHNALRAAGLEEGIYNDPELAKIAEVFSQDVSTRGYGYVEGGEQAYDPAYANAPLPFKAVGWLATEVVAPAVAGVADVGFNMGYGLMNLGAMAVEGMTGIDVHHTMPTVILHDDNGNQIHNGGKLPSGMELLGAMYASMTGDDVAATMKEVGLADQYASLRRSGIDAVVAPVSNFVGSVAGFVTPGGWAMAGGQALLKNGLIRFVGAERLAAMSPWAHKLTSVLTNTSGAAFGNSMFVGTTYGHHEGYANALIEGAVVTPVILTLGAMGRGVERGMLQLPKMPKTVARAVSGAMEGAGFGLYQLASGDEAFHGSDDLWDFMQDPTEEKHARWSQVMWENVLGMMIFKSAFGTTPGQFALDKMQGFGPEVGQARGREKTLERDAADFAEAREKEAGVTEEEMDFLRAPEAEFQPPAISGERRGEPRETPDRRRTAQKLRKVRQQRRALETDPMTKLNTPEMFRRAEKRVDADPEMEWVQVDVRGLKELNDLISMEAGDLQIRRTGSAVKQIAKELGVSERSIFRAGGDEFGIAVKKGRGAEVGEAIREMIGESTVAGTEMKTGARFGVGETWAAASKAVGEAKAAEQAPTLRGEKREGVQQVRERPGEGERGVLPEVSRRGAEEAPGDQPAVRGAAAEGQLPEPGRARPAEGVPGEGAVRAVRRPDDPDAPQGLREAPAGEVAVPPVPPERPPGAGAPRGTPRVSPETYRELGDRVLEERRTGRRGAADQAREAARLEQSGATQELAAERARELLYEDVSARGEYPAEGEGVPAEGRPGVEPIHARDVISEAEVGPIAPAVQAGGMGGRKRWSRGYFNTREDLIRMEGARDLNNLAHEWGHALWGKLGARMPLSPRARAQLLEVGAPTSTAKMRTDQKMHEGMAEFMARHLLGDAELPQRHPDLWTEVMGFLGRPEQSAVREQLSRLESAYGRWRDQGALNQLRMSWVSDDEPMTVQEAQLILGRPIKRLTPWVRARVSWRKAVTSFEHAMVDDLARVKRAQDKILKAAGVDPGTVPITSNPARMMNAVRNKSGAVMETFLFRQAMGFAGVGGKKGPSLREVLSKIKPEEREHFTDYLVARRSLEAMDKGMPVQLSRDRYLLGVERYGNPRFERAAQELKSWFDHLIDYSVEAGALTEIAGGTIKDSWVVYVPFFRSLRGPRQVAPGRGVAERGAGVQRMAGSEFEIRDPLEAAIEVGQSIIQKAHQAAAMKAFYNLHLTTEGVGRFVTEVPRDVKPTEVTFDALADALERLNFPGDIQHIAETFADALRDLTVEDAQAVITMFTQESRPKGSKPIVAFVPRYTGEEIARFRGMEATKAGYRTLTEQVEAENGKLKWLRLDNDAYEAVMNVDPMNQLQHPILRALTVPATVVKFGATAVNPAFTIRNITRDTLLNAMFTDVKTSRRFIPVVGAVTNFVEGLVQQTRETTLERAPGQLLPRLNVKGIPEAELMRDLGGMQATFFGREFGMPSGQVMNARGPAEAYRKMLGGLAAPEATLRIREFTGIRTKALAEGKSELEANFEALEAGQEVSVNFIRAGAVGRSINQFVPYFNAGIQGNRKFLRHVLGYEGPAKQKQAIAQGIANITLPSFVLWMLYKDEDWYLDLPSWRRNNYWTIPIPFTDELFTMPKPFEAGKIFGNIPEYLMNLTDGEPVPLSEMGYDVMANFLNGFDWMPAFMGPTIESVTNYSFWRGRAIVPHWMEEGRLPKDQYTGYTTGLSKLLGGWFGFSPPKIEHWLAGHTGGMALTAMRAVDSMTGGTPAAVDPGFAPEDVPFIGSFFRQRPHRQGQAVQDVMDLHRQLNRLAGSDEITPGQSTMRPIIRRVKERISAVKKMVREGRLDPDVGNRRQFELARPVLDAYERMTSR